MDCLKLPNLLRGVPDFIPSCGQLLERFKRRCLAGSVSQCTVAFKMRFVEPLIGSGVVGKLRIFGNVPDDIGRITNDQSRLYIHNHTVFLWGTWHVVDLANDEMVSGHSVLRFETACVHFDLNSEVGAAPFYGIVQIATPSTGVTGSVTGNDQLATAAARVRKLPDFRSALHLKDKHSCCRHSSSPLIPAATNKTPPQGYR